MQTLNTTSEVVEMCENNDDIQTVIYNFIKKVCMYVDGEAQKLFLGRVVWELANVLFIKLNTDFSLSILS